MAFRDYEEDYYVDSMDELREPWERRGTNIVHTMSDEEYLEFYKTDKKKEQRKCRECGSEMILRNGQHGEFFGCSKFPECRYTESVMR